MIWGLVLAAMIYFTARADLTNGLLNLAGMLALATNTGIPVWNESKIGSGEDSKSSNVDLLRTVETNVVGNFYDNVAAVTVTEEVKDKGQLLVCGFTLHYVVANAHAMINDYRDHKIMNDGYFIEHADDGKALGGAIIQAAREITKKMSRVFTEAERDRLM